MGYVNMLTDIYINIQCKEYWLGVNAMCTFKLKDKYRNNKIKRLKVFVFIYV